MNLNEYQNYHETKDHTESNFPYNTYLCSIPLDFTNVPLHWHEEMELIVIKKGQGTVSVDFHTETVSAGDIVLIFPGQLHSIEQQDSFHMEYENILFLPSLCISGEDDLCAARFIMPLMNREILTETFLTPVLTWYGEASGCIAAIDTLCAAHPEGYQLALKSQLFQFFYLLISNQKNRDSLSVPKKKSLQKLKTILKYIEEHYAEPLSVEQMASVSYYSKSHFMKFFKNCMGNSFIDYLNDYRLSIAARLLITTDDAVLDIAQDTGFENLSYFNRLFKRKYQKTPTQYRRQK